MHNGYRTFEVQKFFLVKELRWKKTKRFATITNMRFLLLLAVTVTVGVMAAGPIFCGQCDNGGNPGQPSVEVPFHHLPLLLYHTSVLKLLLI